MINVLLLVLLKETKSFALFESVIFNEELQGITNGEALKSVEEALTSNMEALNDNE